MGTFFASMFMGLFVLMTSVNFALIYQINLKNRLEGNVRGEYDPFRDERRTLNAINVFFGVSYLVRFIWDLLYQGATVEYYGPLMGEDAVFLLSDGLSLLLLVLVHRKNFNAPLETAAASDYSTSYGSRSRSRYVTDSEQTAVLFGFLASSVG